MRLHPAVNASAHLFYQQARIEAGFERAVQSYLNRVRTNLPEMIDATFPMVRNNPQIFAWQAAQAISNRLNSMWPALNRSYLRLGDRLGVAIARVITRQSIRGGRRRESEEEDIEEDLSSIFGDAEQDELALISSLLLLLSAQERVNIINTTVWQGLTLQQLYFGAVQRVSKGIERDILFDVSSIIMSLSPAETQFAQLDREPLRITSSAIVDKISRSLAQGGGTSRVLTAMVKTQVGIVSSAIARGLMLKNADKTPRAMFNAIMDDATCPVCRSYNGKVYYLLSPSSPVIPVHGSCRCGWTPILAIESECAHDDLCVPTFSNWLKRQEDGFQKSVMRNKYREWSEGLLTIRDFPDYRRNVSIEPVDVGEFS